MSLFTHPAILSAYKKTSALTALYLDLYYIVVQRCSSSRYYITTIKVKCSRKSKLFIVYTIAIGVVLGELYVITE